MTDIAVDLPTDAGSVAPTSGDVAPAPPPAPTAPADPTGAPAAPPAPADAPAAAPAPDAPPLSDAEFDTSLDAFEKAAEAAGNEQSLAEARKLRGEAKRFRESSAPIRAAFEGLDESNVGAVLQLANNLKQIGTNPQATFDWLHGSLEAITGQKWAAVDAEPAPADGVAASQIDLTDPAAVQEYIAEQVKAGVTAGLSEHDQTKAEEAKVETERQAIADKLTELGYADHTAPETMVVLYGAKALGGDPLQAIVKAHEARKGELAKLVETQLANQAAPKGDQPVPTNGQAPAGSSPDDLDFDQRVKRDMRKRIDEAFAKPEFDR